MKKLGVYMKKIIGGGGSEIVGVPHKSLCSPSAYIGSVHD